MRKALHHAVLGSLVLVGCIVAGVEIDPALGDDDTGAASGSAGTAGHGPTGGTSQGGNSTRGGTSNGAEGGSESGGTTSGGSESGGTDAGGTDAGGTDGGMDSGGTDAGGAGTGGVITGGAGVGGAGMGGAGAGGAGMSGGGAGNATGGAGFGGAGVGGAAGAGGTAGSSGGGAVCGSIAPGMPCGNEGATCVDAPCGFGVVGRSSCTCPAASSDWSCSACSYAGTQFETQPAIAACYPETADGVACGVQSQVCGPLLTGEYCFCRFTSKANTTWDCSTPHAHWGCTGLHLSMSLTGGSTTHDHLPLTEGEQVSATGNIRSAFATSGIMLPVDMEHTHTVPLQPVHITLLRSGGVAPDLVTNTVDGHFHVYSLMCAP